MRKDISPRIILLSCLATLLAIAGSYYLTRNFVISQAEGTIRDLLLSHKGIHLYVQRVMHPALYDYKNKGEITEEFYAPELFSSSFIVRHMNIFLNEKRRELDLPAIYYKMAAFNPRNPVNKADAREEKLIRMFDQDKELTEFHEIIEEDGIKYLYYAQPFLRNNEACMRCHGKRQDAPRQLQERYPGEGGFNEKVGALRAIISIKAPLEQEYLRIYTMVAGLLAGFLSLLLLVMISRRLQAKVTEKTRSLTDEIEERKTIEQKLRQSEGRLQALVELHSMKHLTEQELCRYALEEAVRLTDSEVGYLHFVEDGEKTISLNYWSEATMKICTAKKSRHYPVENAGIWADCLRLRKPVIHNNYAALSTKKGYPDGHFPIRRHMSVPVFANDQVILIIGVGNKKAPYNKNDSNQLSLFLDNTWAIIKQKRSIEEREQMELQLKQAQKLEAIGTLAGGIAHDFNNILGVIMGYADLAKDDLPQDSRTGKDLDQVITAAERAKNLVKQILAFSRQAESESLVFQPASVVREAVKMIRPTIPSTIKIEQDIDPTTKSVFADPSKFHQVLMNLCTNAYHAMEESGGLLTISLKEVEVKADQLVHEPTLRPGTFVRLTVRDNGPGIPASIRDKIFDPYFTTKEFGKGTGLGLAIVHGIVKSNKGFVELKSEAGQGTAFHIYLPVYKKTVADDTTEEEKSIPTGTEKILLVDDEKMLLEMDRTMLKRLGYEVTSFNDSVDALEAFKARPDYFDLVITDQTMPELTGADLSRRILQIRPDIPIILCTGYSSLISAAKAKDIGIREFTFKPLVKKEIAVIIRRVLNKTKETN